MINRRHYIILFACLCFQVIYSFYAPVYEPGNKCQHSAAYFLSTNSEKMKNTLAVSGGEFGLAALCFRFFPDYHMVCDATTFLFLAKNFPYSYLERNLYIDQPLYNLHPKERPENRIPW